MQIHLHPAIAKEDSVSRQSSIDPFRYRWIHLLAITEKEDRVSRQYNSIDLFRDHWIHLPATTVKEDSVSYQYCIDLFRLLDSLTSCNGKGVSTVNLV